MRGSFTTGATSSVFQAGTGNNALVESSQLIYDCRHYFLFFFPVLFRVVFIRGVVSPVTAAAKKRKRERQRNIIEILIFLATVSWHYPLRQAQEFDHKKKPGSLSITDDVVKQAHMWKNLFDGRGNQNQSKHIYTNVWGMQYKLTCQALKKWLNRIISDERMKNLI